MGKERDAPRCAGTSAGGALSLPSLAMAFPYRGLSSASFAALLDPSSTLYTTEGLSPACSRLQSCPVSGRKRIKGTNTLRATRLSRQTRPLMAGVDSSHRRHHIRFGSPWTPMFETNCTFRLTPAHDHLAQFVPARAYLCLVLLVRLVASRHASPHRLRRSGRVPRMMEGMTRACVEKVLRTP